MNKNIIKYLGDRVKSKELTWNEASEIYNQKTNENINSEALRSRYRKLGHDVLAQEFETSYQDGSIEAQKVVEYNKEIFGDKNKLLDFLGYNHQDWEFIYITTSVWQQHTKEQTTKQLYAVKFKVKPKIAELELRDALKIAQEVFSQGIKPLKIKKEKKSSVLNENKLMFIPQIEAHLGKISDEIETGTNYNYNIAIERVKKIFEECLLMQEREKCGTCLLIIGGDFFNSESNSQTTRGTPQQNDIRYKKMFNIGLELYTEGILTLKNYFDKIDVKITVGNHARAMEYFLYIALSCFFKGDDKIIFSEDYKDTQSYVFGKVGMFFNHGDPNQRRLVSSIPAEFYKEYGATKFRYLFLGHLHKLEQINSENGIIVHRVPAICENDNWHYENRFGIGNIPQHEIMIFDKECGIISNNYICFEESGKKLIRSKGKNEQR